MLQFYAGVGIYFFKNVIEKEVLIAPFLSAYSFSQIAGIFCYPILGKISKTAISFKKRRDPILHEPHLYYLYFILLRPLRPCQDQPITSLIS